MKEQTKTNIFMASMIIFIIVLLTVQNTTYSKYKNENIALKAKLDSITTQLKKNEILLDESYNFNEALTDALIKLYDPNNPLHQKIMGED